MITSQHSRAIAVFSDLEAAGQALDSLILNGLPLANIFLVGQDVTANEKNGRMVQMEYQIEQFSPRMITGTTLGLKKGWFAGNCFGGTVGFCLGLGLLSLPGVGQIVFTSAVIFTLISSGICTAAGGVVGALIGLALTEKQANTYNALIAQGKYLIIMNASETELKRAELILDAQEIRK